MVYLFPLSLYEGEQNVASNHADRCLLPHYLWERIINDETLQNHDLYLMEFSNDTHRVTLSVGGGHHDDDSMVFVPQWVFTIFSEGAPVRYKPLREIPPQATKITIKPLDNMLYHVDINEEVSRYLSDWHVLQEGLMLQIHLQSIDYQALMYIEALEPGPLVLLRGEVPLEVVPMQEEPAPTRPTAHIDPSNSHPHSCATNSRLFLWTHGTDDPTSQKTHATKIQFPRDRSSAMRP